MFHPLVMSNSLSLAHSCGFPRLPDNNVGKFRPVAVRLSSGGVFDNAPIFRPALRRFNIFKWLPVLALRVLFPPV